MNIKRDLVRIWVLCAAMLTSGAQAQFLFVSTNNVITITGYTGPGGTVVIPKKINGLPVTIIGTGAFSSLSNLTSVTLPDNVASIYSQAFYNCTGLTNVTLGNGVTTIGDYAFEYCTNLSNVTIPASIQSLGNYAFAYCSSLNGAYFQGNALSVSGSQFYSDSHAVVYYLPWTTGWGQTFANVPTASYVPPVPFNYTTNNGAITITGYTGSNSLATVPGTIYVTDARNFLPVTSIGPNAFAGSTGLSSVSIPVGVTTIGSFAFQNCSSLSSVSIPGWVTNFGYYAFANCTNLTGVFFGSNAPVISAGELPYIQTFFLNDSNAASYYLPGTTGWSSTFAGIPTVLLPYIYTITNGTIVIRNYTGSGGAVAIPGVVGGLPVVSIGNGAFASCGSLTSVTIPDSVTDIGNGAFAFRGGLTSITLPDSVTDLGIYAFYACSNLAEATISTNVTIIGTSAFDSCTSLTNVNIPNGVAVVGGSAFQNCASLTNIMIPASVINVGQDAFGACGSLLAISVDPQNTNYSSSGGILFNLNQTRLIQYPGGKAGYYTIPNGVTSIGSFAFDSCTGLTSVVISTNVTIIGDWAFSGCSGLTNVTIPYAVTMIGNYAFESCTSLTSVVIPDSVTTIGFHAFDGCTSLTDATIGSGLTYYPWSLNQIWLATMFSDCPNLTSIYLRGHAPRFVWNPTYQIATPTAYYLPWANPSSISNLPTALWLPRIQNSDASFGFQANQFGFNINWAGGVMMVVEACADLANPVWTPLGTNTIAGTVASGSIYFSDPQSTNYPGRFYRIRGTNATQQ
jgi:hypothetical protein